MENTMRLNTDEEEREILYKEIKKAGAKSAVSGIGQKENPNYVSPILRKAIGNMKGYVKLTIGVEVGDSADDGIILPLKPFLFMCFFP